MYRYSTLHNGLKIDTNRRNEMVESVANSTKPSKYAAIYDITLNAAWTGLLSVNIVGAITPTNAISMVDR